MSVCDSAMRTEVFAMSSTLILMTSFTIEPRKGIAWPVNERTVS